VPVSREVAACGLDLPGLGHVINYKLPKAAHADDYVHQIGKNGSHWQLWSGNFVCEGIRTIFEGNC